MKRLVKKLAKRARTDQAGIPHQFPSKGQMGSNKNKRTSKPAPTQGIRDGVNKGRFLFIFHVEYHMRGKSLAWETLAMACQVEKIIKSVYFDTKESPLGRRREPQGGVAVIFFP